MKKILAFSGSMSSDSINQQLIEFTVDQITNSDVEVIRLSDFEAPIYSKERESETGIPESIKSLRKKFDESDAYILSTPEYNGSIPGGLKNTLDWISRTEGKIFQDKPLLLMAASPGGRGGQSVLGHLETVVPYWGASSVVTFSFPSFHSNLVDGKMSEELLSTLKQVLDDFTSLLG